MQSGSILKIINTKAHSSQENNAISQKYLKYILRPEATNSDLIFCNMVDKSDIFNSFGLFAKSIGKNNGRPLKHIVLSYSTKNTQELSPTEYLKITKEIANFYGTNYQMVIAVHDNVPNRPHAHIIMDCLNVETELKYSESISELNKFKDFTDKILNKYHLPKLLRKKNIAHSTKTLENISSINYKNPDTGFMILENSQGRNFSSPIEISTISTKTTSLYREINNFYCTEKQPPLFDFNYILGGCKNE